MNKPSPSQSTEVVEGCKFFGQHSITTDASLVDGDIPNNGTSTSGAQVECKCPSFGTWNFGELVDACQEGVTCLCFEVSFDARGKRMMFIYFLCSSLSTILMSSNPHHIED